LELKANFISSYAGFCPATQRLSGLAGVRDAHPGELAELCVSLCKKRKKKIMYEYKCITGVANPHSGTGSPEYSFWLEGKSVTIDNLFEIMSDNN
jgi:hypothetical protein